MLKSVARTDIGKTRKLNQDYMFASENKVGNLPNLFMVADGMGGHNAGDFASRNSVETILNAVMQEQETNPVTIVRMAIEKANEYIYKKSMEESEFYGMGTTVVVAVCMENYLQVANVGDSRLYIINPKRNKIIQVTKDHSFVEEMVRIGNIDRESARNHPDKNIITRAIGAQDEVDADFFQVLMRAGDYILMCSDGLTNMLADEAILNIMSEQNTILEKADALINAANNNGGRDNIAVIIIEPNLEEVNQ